MHSLMCKGAESYQRGSNNNKGKTTLNSQERAPVVTDKIQIGEYKIEFASVKTDDPKTIIYGTCPQGYVVEHITVRDITMVAKGFQKVRRAIKRHKKQSALRDL